MNIAYTMLSQLGKASIPNIYFPYCEVVVSYLSFGVLSFLLRDASLLL